MKNNEDFNKFLKLVNLIKISENKLNNQIKMNRLKYKLLNLNLIKYLYNDLSSLLNK